MTNNDNERWRAYGFNPNIISRGPAIDVTDWEPEQLDEYAKLMKDNREEAEACYDLAVSQLNTMTAATAVVLSIIAAGLLMSDLYRNPIVLTSLCFIIISVALSGYASAKSRIIKAIYPVENLKMTSARNMREFKVASINAMLNIVESHRKETERKRKYLDWSLAFFILGLFLMFFGIVLSIFI